MTIQIKLKAGYFKTQLYELAIDEGNITLTPLENEGSTIFIKNNELKSIGYKEGETKEGELEIITKDTIYIGSLTASDNVTEIYQLLSKGLEGKFIFYKDVIE